MSGNLKTELQDLVSFALAVMIFGQWKPVNIGLAALLFGLFRALSNVYTGFDVLVALKLPRIIYNMLPYIISLVVLIFVSKNSKGTKGRGDSLR